MSTGRGLLVLAVALVLSAPGRAQEGLSVPACRRWWVEPASRGLRDADLPGLAAEAAARGVEERDLSGCRRLTGKGVGVLRSLPSVAPVPPGIDDEEVVQIPHASARVAAAWKRMPGTFPRARNSATARGIMYMCPSSAAADTSS